MTLILYILALGYADQMRGSGTFKYHHLVGQIAMGIVVATILHVFDPLAMAYVVAMVAWGSSPGWGNPLGAAYDGRPMEQNHYEWWQVGILRRSTIAALAVRGFMWGVGLLPVSVTATIAFTVAFVAAPYLARWMKLSWAWMEFTRGALVAFLIITMG